MKTISIGDIHGLNLWNEINPDKYDKIIFIGDYVDSFDISSHEIITNLLNIITFKKSYNDKVELLWGNHDLQYLFLSDQFRCTGFRDNYAIQLTTIFNENYKLFKLAYQVKNYLWTHAGISNRWFNERLIPFLTAQENSEESGEKEKTYKFNNLADELNYLFDKQTSCLFDICSKRGGYKPVGGPFWLDKTDAQKTPLKGYQQIVGHNRVGYISSFIKDSTKTSITFIDCLEQAEEQHVRKFFELEI